MLNLSNPWMKLFIQSDNGKFRVRAICTSAGEANVICDMNPALGVICEDEKTGLIFVADLKPTP